jgi:PAS domain S-box-containing protein
MPLPDAASIPRESVELFRVVVESAPNAIVVVDGAGEIQLLNVLTEQLFGYSREELLGQSVEILLPEKARAQHRELRGAFIRTPHARMMGAGRDLRARRKDGSEFPVEIGLSPAQTEEGLFIVAMIVDITERKRMEADLRSARERAEAAARAKGNFLASMSHEIRTPMNGIIGMANLLAATSLDSEQQEYASTIVYSADCLLTILNDILDYSKIEAGRMHIEALEFDLLTAVKATVALLAARANEKGIHLNLRYQPSLPRRFLGDSGRIRQILVNLLSNAVKFTAHGQVAIEVSGEPDFGAWKLTVAVEDSGIGIAPEKLRDLFQEFVQADETTARTFGGTGLGLAISKRLTELMGGNISVSSEPGKGSRFWFTLRVPSCE